MQTITINEQDIWKSFDGIPKKLKDITEEEKKNTSCIIFDLKYRNPYILFFPDAIYEFKIDYYKTGVFAGDGFYEYCSVQYDETNNNYKIYGYYSYKGKLHPTKPTRDGEYDIIELDRSFSGFNYFKGPRFTEGPRRGSYDTWILNTKSIYRKPCSPFVPNTKASRQQKLQELAKKVDEFNTAVEEFKERNEKRLKENEEATPE
tara:strand:- start:775 stop:1386 length:612 start_codon:yes stop_codon:yes gene_type:complete